MLWLYLEIYEFLHANVVKTSVVGADAVQLCILRISLLRNPNVTYRIQDDKFGPGCDETQ